MSLSLYLTITVAYIQSKQREGKKKKITTSLLVCDKEDISFTAHIRDTVHKLVSDTEFFQKFTFAYVQTAVLVDS